MLNLQLRKRLEAEGDGTEGRWLQGSTPDLDAPCERQNQGARDRRRYIILQGFLLD